MAIAVLLAAGMVYAMWKCDRLSRELEARAVLVAKAHNAVRCAMHQLADKNLAIARAEQLLDLQRHAQADIERLFLGVVREVDPVLAARLARDFARVNAHLSMHRAIAPHRTTVPARKPTGGEGA